MCPHPNPAILHPADRNGQYDHLGIGNRNSPRGFNASRTAFDPFISTVRTEGGPNRLNEASEACPLNTAAETRDQTLNDGFDRGIH